KLSTKPGQVQSTMISTQEYGGGPEAERGAIWRNKAGGKHNVSTARCRTWQNLSGKLNPFKGRCYPSTACRRAPKRPRNGCAAVAAAARLCGPVSIVLRPVFSVARPCSCAAGFLPRSQGLALY